MVLLYQTDKQLAPTEIGRYVFSTFDAEYDGTHSTFLPQYLLVLSRTDLFFAISGFIASSLDIEPNCGRFVEGLWQQDVAELFLKDDTSEAYQEFNLSPNGAWWSCRFSEYRKRDEGRKIVKSQVQVSLERGESSWITLMKIPLSSLLVDVCFSDTSKLNVCAIQGQNPRHYFSAAQIGELDFHR